MASMMSDRVQAFERDLTETAEAIYAFREAMTISNVKETIRSFLLSQELGQMIDGKFIPLEKK